MKPIYLDYNATTPIIPEVTEAMRPYLDKYFGNPSSLHLYGVQTKKAIEKARQQIAKLINAHADEIIFTSGGTESNNFAIKGFVLANRDKGNHIITSSIEHPSVIEVCKFLESIGFEITYLPVDKYGIINVDDLKKAITKKTCFISIMHANNEVGTIQNIREISLLAKKYNIIVHSDAAQSLGKIPVNVKNLEVDLLSIAGHKIYASKGVGALYIKRGINIQKIIHGADHEQNLRAGTENVLEIVGLGKACEIALRDLDINFKHMKKNRDLLQQKIEDSNLDFKINGHPEKRLPNTLSVSFHNIDANTILSEATDIAASAGAACHADTIDISEVLRSMNVKKEYAIGTIRFSTGRFTREDDIEKAAEIIINTVGKIQTPKGKVIEKDRKEIKLTHFTAGLGCACKIQPKILEKILKKFPIHIDKNVLVSSSTTDDAAVYKINNNTAIVVTTDFFTPIVDEPVDFGKIAAANALSDVYAMGAKPMFALNIVGFPVNRLPLYVINEILSGAEEKAKEAGIAIIGGHSIENNEPIYGMVVVGKLHPDKIWKNKDYGSGDVFVLSKPIGSGIMSTALKRGILNENQKKQLLASLEELNVDIANILEDFHVTACTDITGFGLLGHIYEMVKNTRIDIQIDSEKVTFLPGLEKLVAANIFPGGTRKNLDYVKNNIIWNRNISKIMKIILCDAQTSGGLLASIPNREVEAFLSSCKTRNLKNISIIGKALNTRQGKIYVN